MSVTLIDTVVQNIGYLLDNAGDQLLVTNAGAVIEDNSTICVQINNSGNHAVTVDGLFYSVDNGGGVAAALNGGSTSFYINGQVEGDLGVDVSEAFAPTTANFISVGSQGSIVGLATNAVLFSGSSAATDDRLDNAGNISANLTAVSVTGDGGDLITNSGNIGGLVGVGFSSNLAMETVDNSGTMTGGSSTVSAAIESVGSSAGIDITNSGLLTDSAANTTGGSSAPLYFDDNAGTTSTITNQGNITGSGYVIQSISDLLDISNSGTILGGLDSADPVDVDNSGVWKGQVGSAAIFLLDGGDNSVTNTASGVIDGAISTVHSHDTFNNDGAIDGSLGIASGSDTITNAGGIDGAITFTGSGNTNSLTNSGKITGAVAFSGGYNAVDNSGLVDGEVSIAHSHDTFTNTGTIDGLVSIPAGSDTVTNAGTIAGQVMFWSTGTGNSLTNSGSITGDVTLPGSSSAANHGQIYGDVILGASDTLTNTGTIHGNVNLSSSDTFDVSPGIVTGLINAGASDLFQFGGDFGKVTFDDFVAGSGSTHDTIQFAANDFSTFSQVQAASSQAGSDVVIKLDATDSITLNNVTLASLTSANFTFV